jgi:hypothetical protein
MLDPLHALHALIDSGGRRSTPGMKRPRSQKPVRQAPQPVSDLNRVVAGALNAYLSFTGETQGKVNGSATAGS